ncbi:hypothetical protein DSO57_1024903 [Entomophthora muscae]|uniref:Uncharacterized protein n=1 Tax=Entomophthora muscae TaxID=34485 RepID=A0ACC2T2Y2_9FUNG|nr:hypothetical protein DSO57_1024903 [Entomophthora muscae]
MTPPLTPQPDHLLEPTAAAETTSTQLFGVLYITLIGLLDSVVPNSGPWSLLRRSVSYIIKLAPILWWSLPTGSAEPHPKLPNASTYDWLPDKYFQGFCCFPVSILLLWAIYPSVATKFPDLPANVSYNTQGALNEPPLDVSNIMG